MSNAGFIVLGGVVEQLSGQTYADYAQAHIFGPAGMQDTGFTVYALAQGDARLARNYTTDTAKGDEVSVFVLPGKGGPAGGGYSTVGDLVRFGLALQSNRLLSPEMTRLMTKGMVGIGGNSSYGYGILDYETGGHRVVGHGGGGPGINGELAVYWEQGWILSALSNIDPPAANRVVEIFGGLLSGSR